MMMDSLDTTRPIHLLRTRSQSFPEAQSSAQTRSRQSSGRRTNSHHTTPIAMAPVSFTPFRDPLHHQQQQHSSDELATLIPETIQVEKWDVNLWSDDVARHRGKRAKLLKEVSPHISPRPFVLTPEHSSPSSVRSVTPRKRSQSDAPHSFLSFSATGTPTGSSTPAKPSRSRFASTSSAFFLLPRTAPPPPPPSEDGNVDQTPELLFTSLNFNKGKSKSRSWTGDVEEEEESVAEAFARLNHGGSAGNGLSGLEESGNEFVRKMRAWEERCQQAHAFSQERELENEQGLLGSFDRHGPGVVLREEDEEEEEESSSTRAGSRGRRRTRGRKRRLDSDDESDADDVDIDGDWDVIPPDEPGPAFDLALDMGSLSPAFSSFASDGSSPTSPATRDNFNFLFSNFSTSTSAPSGLSASFPYPRGADVMDVEMDMDIPGALKEGRIRATRPSIIRPMLRTFGRSSSSPSPSRSGTGTTTSTSISTPLSSSYYGHSYSNGNSFNSYVHHLPTLEQTCQHGGGDSHQTASIFHPAIHVPMTYDAHLQMNMGMRSETVIGDAYSDHDDVH